LIYKQITPENMNYLCSNRTAGRPPKGNRIQYIRATSYGQKLTKDYAFAQLKEKIVSSIIEPEYIYECNT
jgi:hypothetical protein